MEPLGRRNVLLIPIFQECEMVDEDRVKGSAEQAKGKAKEWAGKATGDAKTEG